LSAQSLIGHLDNDAFSFKVSQDGSAFGDAVRIDRLRGQAELPQPTGSGCKPELDRP
jgi:hypothetical protein